MAISNLGCDGRCAVLELIHSGDFSTAERQKQTPDETRFMTPNEKSQQQWKACRPGMLSDVVSDLKSRRSPRTTTRGPVLASLLALVALIGFAAWQYSGPQDHDYGGIHCRQVHQHMRSYLAGTLSDDVADRIAVHVKHCNRCRAGMETMQSSNASWTPHASVSIATASR